ncbi:type II toxin-antitoxin system RelE/ParE family toxin [Methylosinus sp. Sm6]|uniref:type II toxin-antitoxin system RelE/ParE family toxin n=1 Tax=Methylosinus sp. Sm6 TaxID=2866948 RepID=UPI001C99E7AD|nr:type II toxin-antitoxin system RelE/ParE family toxin [Methylosinus sp. Sm6]
MRIVRSARAEEDLIEIWAYVARDDESAADRLLDRLERKTRLLGENPKIGRERNDIAVGVRSTVCGSYLLLYRIEADHVELVRYIHMRRSLEGAAR